MLNRAGKVSLITEPTAPYDARLRRPQALSHQSGTALEVMRELGATTEELYQSTFDINVKGVLFTVQKALPLLSNGASIILSR